jgi:hypothetical protein
LKISSGQCKYLIKTGKKQYKNERLGFSFFILWAQVLIAALAAGGCADCIACVTVHAYLHID